MTQIQPPITRFIIFSMARSGTSWLTTSLRSHPEILCHGEALLPRHVPNHLFGTAKERLTAEMCEANPVGFLQELFSLNDGNPIVGCKVFPGHSKPAHNLLMEDESISKIVLRRENALASWSSLLIARATGRWNTSKQKVSQDVKAFFVTEDFEKFVQRGNVFFEKADRFIEGPRLDINYSDDVLDQRMQPILEFLGASTDFTTESNKKKMLSRSIIERYENPETVLTYLEQIGRPDWAYE